MDPEGFSTRRATRDDKHDVLEVLLRSFSMDAVWNDSYLRLEQYFSSGVERLFQSPDLLCLILQKGTRPVAVSLLDPDPDAENHLLSGPAVTMEYRNRGIGSALLLESLRTLAASGLSEIRGITRDRTMASRYLYPKYGSVLQIHRFPGQET